MARAQIIEMLVPCFPASHSVEQRCREVDNLLRKLNRVKGRT